MKTTFIYGLVIKGDDNIRYIGKSDYPNKRLKKHIYNTKLKIKKGLKLTHKDNWIIKNNFNIDLIILEECDYKLWEVTEINYINSYDNLTNTSKGGLGGAGIKYKLSYDEVKIWVINNLNIQSKNEWYQYVKNNELPNFIPSNPREVYLKRGWVSWGDFLGSNNIWDNNIKYLDFNVAKKILKKFNISSATEYKKLFEENKLPKGLPRKPNRYYKKRGWVSWGDFLSNGLVANQLKEFYTYEEFKSEINKLNLTTFTSFKKYIKENKKNKKIPTNPNIIYKNKGWVGWSGVIS
jgi:hypothetical protein